jgi:hypothetical protein
MVGSDCTQTARAGKVHHGNDEVTITIPSSRTAASLPLRQNKIARKNSVGLMQNQQLGGGTFQLKSRLERP